MPEEWRPVPGGFPYEVSTLGRVRRTAPGRRTQAGRLMQPSRLKGGLGLRLTRATTLRGERVQVIRFWLVHRLVWTVFVGPLPPYADVLLKNGDKHDARLANLARPAAVYGRTG